jgi:hypothetical protein
VGGKGGGWEQVAEMTQALYAHMNNKKINNKKNETFEALNVNCYLNWFWLVF